MTDEVELLLVQTETKKILASPRLLLVSFKTTSFYLHP